MHQGQGRGRGQGTSGVCPPGYQGSVVQHHVRGYAPFLSPNLQSHPPPHQYVHISAPGAYYAYTQNQYAAYHAQVAPYHISAPGVYYAHTQTQNAAYHANVPASAQPTQGIQQLAITQGAQQVAVTQSAQAKKYHGGFSAIHAAQRDEHGNYVMAQHLLQSAAPPDGDGDSVQKIEKTLNLPYFYYVNSMKGKLVESDLCILANTEVGAMSANRSHFITHSNFLPFVGNDTISNPKTPTALFHQYDETLRSHVLRNQGTNQALVCLYTVPVQINCPPSQLVTYAFVPDIYRRFIRGAIKCMVYLHSKNLSLSTLSLDKNLVIHENKLKLYGLRFLEDSDEDTKRNDFILLANALEELFGICGMPEDIEHLCAHMKKYKFSNDDGIFLCNHLAILKTSRRIEMVKAFYERNELLSSGNPHINIFLMMKSDDWTVHFDGTKPGYGPILSAYNRKSKAGLSIYHMHSITQEALNETAIRFSRNIEAHILEHVGHIMGKHKACLEDIDLMTMAVFSKQLLSFQASAHKIRVMRFLL